MKLIVGLGNPGTEYEQTRHNIGFVVVDELARLMDVRLQKEKFEALYGTAQIEGEKVILVKPQTFMNLSGMAVRKFLDYWKLSPEELLVIHDDVDFPLGTMKQAFDSRAAGHRGVASIIDELASQQFYRLRLGIGRPLKGDVVNFVLTRFHDDEGQAVQDVVQKAVAAIRAWVNERQGDMK